MNVLRSFARDLVQFLQVDRAAHSATPVEVGGQSLQPVREQKVAPVLGLGRFRDGFEGFPQGAFEPSRPQRAQRVYLPELSVAAQLRNLGRDGFEPERRAPVDLSGGSRAAARVAAFDAPPIARGGFTASLEDLAGL